MNFICVCFDILFVSQVISHIYLQLLEKDGEKNESITPAQSIRFRVKGILFWPALLLILIIRWKHHPFYVAVALAAWVSGVGNLSIFFYLRNEARIFDFIWWGVFVTEIWSAVIYAIKKAPPSFPEIPSYFLP